jgi:meiotically up-regulated gene 157 (Mug157) protein
MERRKFLQQTGLASAGMLLTGYSFASNHTNDFPVVRIPETQRKFKSKAVEQLIKEIKQNTGNKEIAWMFENCFPNTLDTTVDFEILNGRPDTYVITGDIDAMWLRDSSAQVWPYLPLCKEDKDLQQLIRGVIHRQAKCIIKDPYANAFYKDETKISEWKDDLTTMKPGVHERKWEIDSLCYPIRLSYGYWKITGDTSAFDDEWKQAMRLIIQTFKEQQRWHDKGPYHFQRYNNRWSIEGIPLDGYGNPVKPNGLICSIFRPSDDATIFPYLIPSNFFALESLMQLQKMGTSIGNCNDIISAALELSNVLRKALNENAVVNHAHAGNIYAFEVDGYGSHTIMDDANVPSLLSLSYLVPAMKDDKVYKNTRQFALSQNNPFFYKGKIAEGIGGPHAGVDMIWPLSIIMRGITSADEKEIKMCLDMLQKTHANTGFMHESFHKDDATKFTRKWFAWANTLFGEFIWKVYKERKYLLS